MKYNIKDIVKNETVEFDHYRAGNLYYSVWVNIEENPAKLAHYKKHLFPVPISDTGEASFMNIDKAILFMRYIRKAIEDKTFVQGELGT
jgi:hypothetical protein